MKTKTFFTAMLCLVAVITATAQTPISPRAAMANCDALTARKYVTIEERNAFLKKNEAMNVGVQKWMEQFKPEGKEFAFAGKKTAAKPMKPAKIDPEKQMANLQRMAQDMKTHYKLTDKEFAALQRMSNKQGEAFIKKRCQELGIQPLDPSKYGMQYDPDEYKAQQRRDADAPKMQEATENIEAYYQRSRQVGEKNRQLYHQAEIRVGEAFKEKWKMLEKLHAKAEETLPSGVGGDEAAHKLAVQAYIKKNIEVQMEEYNMWLKEYILPARENLQGLLSYAEAADDGKFFMLKSLLPDTQDEEGRMAIKNQYAVGAASAVWEQFRIVTEQKVP